ncbi:O-fucosyltransferase 10 isoform X2 [Capsicum annuum]|uniref:O-fucosyltransferase 10 isoform X2 n=1 Tax=Capsicum annuum TaxID=4072 RepID=UPI0007BFE732|nr:O-fucosyltransferase 10 isoform X2 [Capsicum annuum]
MPPALLITAIIALLSRRVPLNTHHVYNLPNMFQIHFSLSPFFTMSPKNANGYATSNNNNNILSSPPTSPSNRKNCRRRLRRRGSFAMLHRRNVLLIVTVLYFTGLISCVGPLFSLLQYSGLATGAVYRSHEIFQKFWNDIEADNSSTIELSSVWIYKRKLKEQKTCSIGTTAITKDSPGANLYLIVDANGGLNQQRSSICNAVVIAALLNATLLIPHLEFHNVWRDSSKFGDIYDEDHFISTLKDYITVVKKLPAELMERYDSNISNIQNLRVQAWAPPRYYLEEVYPVLFKWRVVRISPFANRLSMHLPSHLQFLRCFSNYEALRFSLAISALAKKLVKRMIERSSNSVGKYISVHLRFEEDMVAFSCCIYDGGQAEKSEMDVVREKGWGKKFKQKYRVIAPGLNRKNGKCPMTPVEVGMMLRGMGFAKDTPIYLASGKIYQADRYLAPLRKMFPLLQTKETLATKDELAPFEGYSSRLAAVDYLVCLFSEVFVTTQGGNFPHFLIGHRRYLYNGHAKTIKPDKIKLVTLLQNTSTSWIDFKHQMGSMLAESDRKGIMVPRVKKSTRKGSIYSNPLPECRCLWESERATNRSNSYLMVDH